MRLSILFLAALALPLAAQTKLQVAASGRASTSVSVAPPVEEGKPAPTPAKITIDYGQPHARGRVVVGALAADLDTVWRLGANEATSLTTGVDLVIGGLSVPKGEYTLYAQTSKSGAWKLVVNKRAQSLGNEYQSSADLGRVELQGRTLGTPLESLTIWLVPAGGGALNGELRFAWGSREFSAPWSVKQ